MKTRFNQIIVLTMIALLILSAVTFNQTGLAQQGGSPVFLPIVAKNTGSTPTPPPSEAWTDAEEAAINAVVTDGGTLEKLAEDEHEYTTEVLTQTIDGEDYWLNVENHYVVQNKTDVLYLGSNDDIIWPGALIEGDQAHEFVYTPIALPRAPLMLSVNLENVACAGELTHEVVDPNLSNIREGIRQLLQEAREDCDVVPAQAQFQRTQVYNESHLNLALGASVDSSVVDLKTRFSWEDTSKKNKIIAKYEQVLYEVNINTPLTQAEFFDASRTSVAEIGDKIPAGSNPMYVAGVKYGMMALMFFETNYSKEMVDAAIDLTIQRGISATITGTLTAQNVLDASDIEIVVYGGSTAGLETIYTGTAGFEEVIKASASGGPDAPGVPLVYKFRHFSDNNLALITLTSDYSLSTNRFPVYPKIRVALDSFKLTSLDWEDDPFITVLEMLEMAIYVSAKNCSLVGVCADALIIDDEARGMFGLEKLSDDPASGWPDTWNPDPNPYVEFRYDNSKDPYDWEHAWLSVRARAVEDDLLYDPDDVAEDTVLWDGQILEGASLNPLGYPEKEYIIPISKTDPDPWPLHSGIYSMDVKILVTLMNP